jgi:hypothetical protein
LAGVTETECESLLAELDRNGVFSRTRQGVIYSRRMVRDVKRSKKNREIGKMGGNPSLRNHNDNSEWDNPPDKGEVKTQRPETRNQKPEKRTEPEDIPRILRPTDLVDEPTHRALIADLKNRGRDTLTGFEKTFLNGVLGLKTITRKQREILDAIALKVSEMPKPESPKINWQTRIDHGRQFGRWPKDWGPRPNEPGCLVPPELVHPNDGFGWAEWVLKAS